MKGMMSIISLIIVTLFGATFTFATPVINNEHGTDTTMGISGISSADEHDPAVPVETGQRQRRRRHHHHRRRMMLNPYDPYGGEPTVSPADACVPDSDIALELWNTDTDMPIGMLDKTIDLCLYGGVGLSIVALPSCKDKVKFKFHDWNDNQIYKHTEGVAPMSMGGDDGYDLLDVPALHVPGSYVLYINPKPGKKKEFHIDIIDDCTVP